MAKKRIRKHPSGNAAEQNILKLSDILALVIFAVTILLIVLYRFPSLTFKSDLKDYTQYFKNDFSNEKVLLTDIRTALSTGERLTAVDQYHFDFNPDYSQIYITLFQRGRTPLRYGSLRNSLPATLERIIRKLRQRRSFASFDVADADKCRILFEIVQSEKRVPLVEVGSGRFTQNRFEPGINGLKFVHKGQPHYFMPTDAVVYSHWDLNQALNEMAKKVDIGKTANKISERIKKLMRLKMACFLLTSKAFVTHGNDILPLYRGYPVPVEFSRESIGRAATTSADWLVDNMNSDGSFIYYYDGVNHITKNTPKFQNGNRGTLYNYILMHSGAIIALLDIYDRTQDKKYLSAAKNAVDYLIKNTRQHNIHEKPAYYVYYNDKAKLGATGIALAAVAQYYRTAKDKSYHAYMEGMARHLLSRIEPDGEMLEYYIHPDYNGGKPIIRLSPEEKRELFSPPFAGEALLGLALYAREVELEPGFSKELRRLSKLALDFQVDTRPERYKEIYKSLPPDGRLMQAVEAWSHDKEFQKETYSDFIYDNAETLMAHMYDRGNSKYYDYPGAFFSNYGDVCHPDAARSEGLMAAYYLARRMKKTELAEKILERCQLAATSLLYTYHSKRSTFMHKYPEKVTGAFKPDYISQWVRIDSIQHTVCFYKRLYDALSL